MGFMCESGNYSSLCLSKVVIFLLNYVYNIKYDIIILKFENIFGNAHLLLIFFLFIMSLMYSSMTLSKSFIYVPINTFEII